MTETFTIIVSIKISRTYTKMKLKQGTRALPARFFLPEKYFPRSSNRIFSRISPLFIKARIMGGGSKNGKIIQQSKQYKEGNVKRENSQTVHDPSN